MKPDPFFATKKIQKVARGRKTRKNLRRLNLPQPLPVDDGSADLPMEDVSKRQRRIKMNIQTLF